MNERYQVKEMPTDGYPKRTKQNIVDSNGNVIFVHGKLSGGSSLTNEFTVDLKKPCLYLDMSKYSIDAAADNLYLWIKENQIEVLNVAGRSASKDREIYAVVFEVIKKALSYLNDTRYQHHSHQNTRRLRCVKNNMVSKWFPWSRLQLLFRYQ